eukprot:6786025-Alexandrium_andersonii.AAC.1
MHVSASSHELLILAIARSGFATEVVALLIAPRRFRLGDSFAVGRRVLVTGAHVSFEIHCGG